MRIIVASKNPVKIDAVKEVIKNYDFLSKATVDHVDINNVVSDQPKTLEETVSGALKRSKEAFETFPVYYDYSFGIESGFMKVPGTLTGEMDISVCSVYNGRKHSLGISCAFEVPPMINKLIHEEKINMSQACLDAGLTNSEYLGYDEGIIGILTKGRITRKDYTKQAIQMALIQIENPELYKR